MVYVTGNPHDPANKGYRIWYKAAVQGETPPENPGELHESFFTKRKKDVIEFALTKGLPAYAVNRQTPYGVCFINLSAGH
jgi:hypothetical protein